MNAVPVPGLGQNTLSRGTVRSDDAHASAKLRVGVLVKTLRLQNWAAHLVQQLIHSDGLELSLVVVDHREESAGPRRGGEPLLFTGWRWLDRRLHAREGDALNILNIRDLAPMLKDIRIVEVSFPATDRSALEWVRASGLDVILALDGRPPAADFASFAKFGLWYLPGCGAHGDSATPMFWAAYDCNTACETTLQVLTDHREPQVIYRSYSATNDVSPFLGESSNSWKAADAVLRRLTDLKRHGWDHVRTPPSPPVEAPRTDKLPGNLATARFLLRWFAGVLDYQFNYRLRKEQWFIAYRTDRGAFPLSVADMSGFKIVSPPRDRFYADPFAIERNGRHYVFFEDYRYQQRKGLISFFEVDEQGRCGQPEVVLEAPYHLSYPFVFEHEGELFLIPETRDNKTVELYRSLDFPRRWVLEKVLLKDAPAVDPTILAHDGKLWMFVGGMVEKASPNDELFLFSADSLFGEWSPHPKNPIVSDVRRARPAGKLFFHDGRLIRPSQDCSTRYGFGILFNHVETLSPTDYREAPVGYISPEWHVGNLGSHTWNQDGRIQVVDGRVRIFK